MFAGLSGTPCGICRLLWDSPLGLEGQVRVSSVQKVGGGGGWADVQLIMGAGEDSGCRRGAAG